MRDQCQWKRLYLLSYDGYTNCSGTTHFYTLELLYGKQRKSWIHYFLLLKNIHVDFVSDNFSTCAWTFFNYVIMACLCFNNLSLHESSSCRCHTIYLNLQISSSSIGASSSSMRVFAPSSTSGKFVTSRSFTIILNYQFLIIWLNGELRLKHAFNEIFIASWQPLLTGSKRPNQPLDKHGWQIFSFFYNNHHRIKFLNQANYNFIHYSSIFNCISMRLHLIKQIS